MAKRRANRNNKDNNIIDPFINTNDVIFTYKFIKSRQICSLIIAIINKSLQ